MYELPIPEAWFSWLTSAAFMLAWTIPGFLAYSYLADRMVFEGRGRLPSLRFGSLDVVIGSLLTLLFLLLTVAGFRAAAAERSQAPELPGSGQMIAGTVVSALVFVVVIGGILASLTARGIRWRDCFGLTRLGPVAVMGRGMGLIVLAIPLIVGMLALARVLLAATGYVDNSPQDIVYFLEHDQSTAARWVVATFAIVVAPMEEEFLFRGYLYGVLRRYVGPAAGIVLNAALFAAIHAHLPSFAGLFVLAVCLSLAYEWSGSLFVPMVMHALFNSLTVIDLFTGGSNGM